jgi:molybdopterin-containing oxidoreductase family membrane subunit
VVAVSLVLGIFANESDAVTAVRALADTPWRVHRVHSPIPSHHLADALKLKTSRVGYFTLAGGIIGFFVGFCLAIYCSWQWKLIVGGKPIIALIPFFIVGFEFTILFAVFGNVIGLLTQARLPNFRKPGPPDARLSGSHFGVVGACRPDGLEELKVFFQQRGAEVKVLDAQRPRAVP